MQPGLCRTWSETPKTGFLGTRLKLSRFVSPDAEDVLSCSHSRSIYLFTESINSPCPFYGFPCSDMAALESNEGGCMQCGWAGCPIMGYSADQSNARGKYFLKTRASGPFCGMYDRIPLIFNIWACPYVSIGIVHFFTMRRPVLCLTFYCFIKVSKQKRHALIRHCVLWSRI